MTTLFPPLPAESRRILDRLPRLIDKTFPLPARFRSGLPRDVAELSRLLTASREDRSASYLGKPPLLSAYLRYFLPWNIYRLCRLLPALPLELKSGDTVNDLGSGPLTLAAALWISRPDLRTLPLEFRCIDRTPAILDAGKKLFAALAAETTGDSSGSSCPWIIKTIRGELRIFGSHKDGGLSVEIKGKPAALTAAINVYNELFWKFSPLDTEGIAAFASRSAHLLSSLTESSGSILVMEPGIPRCGEFISLLRSSLLTEGRRPLSPCTHSEGCPLSPSPASGVPRKSAGKAAAAKWCHFAFDTEDAPSALHKLSAASGIPKERAVLSFILAGGPSAKTLLAESPLPAKVAVKPPSERKSPAENAAVKIRVISDAFPIEDGWGRYGCSECGLALVRGSRKGLEASPSGALEVLPLADGVRDGKSGAFVVRGW